MYKRQHRHPPDVIGVAQGAPEGEARLPHRQGGVHRGIGRAVQGLSLIHISGGQVRKLDGRHLREAGAR